MLVRILKADRAKTPRDDRELGNRGELSRPLIDQSQKSRRKLNSVRRFLALSGVFARSERIIHIQKRRVEGTSEHAPGARRDREITARSAIFLRFSSRIGLKFSCLSRCDTVRATPQHRKVTPSASLGGVRPMRILM